MNGRIGCALVIALASEPARADAPMPVYVTVVGTGQIRVILAAGGTVPCDSTSNRLFFDGKLSAGQTYAFTSPSPLVCERHTYGAFREQQWSPDYIRMRPRFVDGRPIPWRLDLTLSTNGY